VTNTLQFRAIKQDDDGVLLRVPLGRTDKEAIIDPLGLAHLMHMGLTFNWHCTPKGYVLASAKDGQKVSVARVLIDAKEGEHVRFKDRNPLNLCRDNLELVPSNKGTKRDRDFIR
jgi:hypothetical protein